MQKWKEAWKEEMQLDGTFQAAFQRWSLPGTVCLLAGDFLKAPTLQATALSLSLSLSEGREDGHFNSYVGRSAPRCDAIAIRVSTSSLWNARRER